MVTTVVFCGIALCVMWLAGASALLLVCGALGASWLVLQQFR